MSNEATARSAEGRRAMHKLNDEGIKTLEYAYCNHLGNGPDGARPAVEALITAHDRIRAERLPAHMVDAVATLVGSARGCGADDRRIAFEIIEHMVRDAPEPTPERMTHEGALSAAGVDMYHTEGQRIENYLRARYGTTSPVVPRQQWGESHTQTMQRKLDALRDPRTVETLPAPAPMTTEAFEAEAERRGYKPPCEPVGIFHRIMSAVGVGLDEITREFGVNPRKLCEPDNDLRDRVLASLNQPQRERYTHELLKPHIIAEPYEIQEVGPALAVSTLKDRALADLDRPLYVPHRASTEILCDDLDEL